jgi:uncharacterized OB-fold protein
VVVGVDPEQVAVGVPVHVTFDQVGEVTPVLFKPS